MPAFQLEFLPGTPPPLEAWEGFLVAHLAGGGFLEWVLEARGPHVTLRLGGDARTLAAFRSWATAQYPALVMGPAPAPAPDVRKSMTATALRLRSPVRPLRFCPGPCRHDRPVARAAMTFSSTPPEGYRRLHVRVEGTRRGPATQRAKLGLAAGALALVALRWTPMLAAPLALAGALAASWSGRTRDDEAYRHKAASTAFLRAHVTACESNAGGEASAYFAMLSHPEGTRITGRPRRGWRAERLLRQANLGTSPSFVLSATEAAELVALDRVGRAATVTQIGGPEQAERAARVDS
ncbi:MAG: hypothetical protein ACYDBQ_07495 [Thermoplasmatota archaeon]